MGERASVRTDSMFEVNTLTRPCLVPSNIVITVGSNGKANVTKYDRMQPDRVAMVIIYE